MSKRNDLIQDNIPPISDWKTFLKESRIYFFKNWPKKTIPTVGLSDFKQVKTIGEGSSGRVIWMKHRHSGTYYAIKVLDKADLVNQNHVKQALSEKRLLQSLMFPFTIRLEFFFQDNSYLYFVLPFGAGGELYKHMKDGLFDDAKIKFYAAQILLALEYLHYLNVLHRDLKPENILLDAQGFLKLADFGCSKLVPLRTYTILGTPEYMAPEIIIPQGYGKPAEYWAFGILLFEMAAGYTPFVGKDQTQTFNCITTGKYSMPSSFSEDLRDIVKKLLNADLTRRLGCLRNGVDDIKNHSFFRDVPWLSILNRSVIPVFIPEERERGDTKYFHNIRETKLSIASIDEYKDDFKHF